MVPKSTYTMLLVACLATAINASPPVKTDIKSKECLTDAVHVSDTMGYIKNRCCPDGTYCIWPMNGYGKDDPLNKDAISCQLAGIGAPDYFYGDRSKTDGTCTHYIDDGGGGDND